MSRRTKRVLSSMLSPLEQLRKEARELRILGADELDAKELARKIAQVKIRSEG